MHWKQLIFLQTQRRTLKTAGHIVDNNIRIICEFHVYSFLSYSTLKFDTLRP